MNRAPTTRHDGRGPSDQPSVGRAEQLRRIRDRIWLHLSPTAEFIEEVAPDAAALLQLGEIDLRQLARLHFVASREVGALLDALPRLIRRLSTTSVADEEWSTERLRGAVQWARTIGARAATGTPALYVIAPTQRAYQTPENELLAFVLDAISRLGRETRSRGLV